MLRVTWPVTAVRETHEELKLLKLPQARLADRVSVYNAWYFTREQPIGRREDWKAI
jgi:hypothetical protein